MNSMFKHKCESILYFMFNRQQKSVHGYSRYIDFNVILFSYATIEYYTDLEYFSKYVFILEILIICNLSISSTKRVIYDFNELILIAKFSILSFLLYPKFLFTAICLDHFLHSNSPGYPIAQF